MQNSDHNRTHHHRLFQIYQLVNNPTSTDKKSSTNATLQNIFKQINLDKTCKLPIYHDVLYKMNTSIVYIISHCVTFPLFIVGLYFNYTRPCWRPIINVAYVSILFNYYKLTLGIFNTKWFVLLLSFTYTYYFCI